MKMRPVGGGGASSSRQTDMTKLLVAFRNFANVPKNLWGEGLRSRRYKRTAALRLIVQPSDEDY
jgi:hypothetical protein